MATPAVKAAVQTTAKAAPLAAPAGLNPVGKTKVYLPSHVITFVRPKPNQPPNHATFKVPMRFNKLDLRDYLFHAYGVRVKGVRAFINMKVQKAEPHRQIKWKRTRDKMMIADLVRPFRWPAVPAEEDRADFDPKQYNLLKEYIEMRNAQQEDRQEGRIPLESANKETEHRKTLREQALAFRGDPGKWKEGSRLMQRIQQQEREREEEWKEVEEDVDFEFEEGTAGKEKEGGKGEKP